MIAKPFEKFSYTSLTISSLMLIGVSYHYTTLDIKWSFVESKIVNGILIFGALMLTNHAIDSITRQYSLERSNRNSYHLLLYPLIVISLPIESIDLRFILSSSAIWSAWRNMRIFFTLSSNTKKIKRILDVSLLISCASLFILENLLLVSIPILLLLTSNLQTDIKYFIVIIFTPIVFLSSVYVISAFFSYDVYLFNSYFFQDQLMLNSDFRLNFTPYYGSLSIVFIIYFFSVIVKLSRAVSMQRRILDLVGVFFFFLIVFFFSMSKDLSGSEFHYLSLILVYFIAQIFAKKINSFYVNLIFMSIIVSIIIFNFLV